MKFDKSLIRQNATSQSYTRGESYLHTQAVTGLHLRDNLLRAEVEGSHSQPYQVRVTLEAGLPVEAHCSCPYDWGGWCKHIVAVLLTALDEPDEIEERPSLDDLVAGLDAEALRKMLRELVKFDASLVDRIEAATDRLQPPTEPAPEDQSKQTSTRPVNTHSTRRRVQGLLHSLDRMRMSEAYWQVGQVVEGIRRELATIQIRLDAGDGVSARLMLEVITEEYEAGWLHLDGSSGETGDFWGELGELWAEALLTEMPAPEEQRKWKERLQEWQRELDDYGVGESFNMALGAIEQGWDDPALRRAMDGHITIEGAWADEAPWFADELALIRLRILEREERFEEYLHLAEAEGQTGLFLAMLAQMGRTQEAIKRGLKEIGNSNEALALAQALAQKTEVEAALQMGIHGLKQDSQYATPLANWLADLAYQNRSSDQALEALQMAFYAAPALDKYLHIQDLSGKAWPKYQKTILETLRRHKAHYSSTILDIFLHENLIDDAINIADATSFYDAVRRVAEAALDTRPAWVIKASKKQAEQIMGAAKAKYYQYAVDWLTMTQSAYQKSDNEAGWAKYLATLREKHGRKYKLMGLIDARF